MNTRFIDFEGIHGCGKTATAWILNKNLNDLGVKSKLFFEADMDAPYENPCDLTFMSAFSYSEFTWLLDSFPEQAARIVENIAFDLLGARKYVLDIDHMGKDELNESVLSKVMEG